MDISKIAAMDPDDAGPILGKALLSGVVAPQVLTTAIVAKNMLKNKNSQIGDVSDDMAKSLAKKMGLSDLPLKGNTAAAASGGGGAYDPIRKKVHLSAKSLKKLTGSELGTLAHELGHAKNFASPVMKKFIMPYMAARKFGPLLSILPATAAAIDVDDPTAAAVATGALTAPSSIMFGEEMTATGRGIRGLQKVHGGGIKGLLKALSHGKGGVIRSGGLSALSYGSMIAAPWIAYALRRQKELEKENKKGMKKKASLEEEDICKLAYEASLIDELEKLGMRLGGSRKRVIIDQIKNFLPNAFERGGAMITGTKAMPHGKVQKFLTRHKKFKPRQSLEGTVPVYWG